LSYLKTIDIVNRVIHETFLIMILIKNCLSKFITLTKFNYSTFLVDSCVLLRILEKENDIFFWI